MVFTRRGMGGREASSFGSRVATVGAHIVCLAKGGGGKGCLAGKALETVAIGGTVIACAVCTQVGLGGVVDCPVNVAARLSWVVPVGIWWIGRTLAVVLTVGIVWYL